MCPSDRIGVDRSATRRFASLTYFGEVLMRILSLKRMSTPAAAYTELRTPKNNDASRRCASWEK